LKDNKYRKNLNKPLITQKEKRQRDKVAKFQNIQARKLKKKKNRFLNKARKGKRMTLQKEKKERERESYLRNSEG